MIRASEIFTTENMASLLNSSPRQHPEAETWSFKDVFGILCRLNEGEPEDRVRARVGQWQRGDVLPASSVGRGVRYAYSNADIVYLCLINELHNLGLPFQNAKAAVDSGSWLTMWKMGTVTFRPFSASRSYIVIEVERIQNAIAKQREVIGIRNMPPRVRDVIDVRKLPFKREGNRLVPMNGEARDTCRALSERRDA